MVPYEESEGVGDIEDVATVLKSLKGDIEVDQPIHETSTHRHEERMDDAEEKKCRDTWR